MTIGRDRYINIIKVIKGSFNKIFLFTINNKYEVIARIFILIVRLIYYTTASEVITMNFLYNRRDILVLRVFT